MHKEQPSKAELKTKNTPASGQIAKKPKETYKIKALLKAYVAYQDRIDLAEERLAFLEYKQGSPSSPNLSGMTGGGDVETSKQERDYIKKEELEEKLKDMYAEENRKREEIEGLIERMEDPNEQTAIEMHYLDGANWNSINAVLHGKKPDYDVNERRYLKRTFKIHGSALQSLARIYNK